MGTSSSPPDDAQRVEGRLQILLHATKAFTQASRSPDSLFDTLVHEIANVLCCGCVLSLIADDGLHFTTSHAHAAEPVLREQLRRRFLTGGPRHVDAVPGFRHVIQTRTPFYEPRVRAPKSAPPDGADAADLVVTSALVVPLVERERIMGVLGLARYEDAPPLEPDDLALAESLAECAALALGTARLFEEATRAAERVRQSEEAHRLLFEASPLPLIVFDVETLRVLTANEAALKLFGYEREAFMRTRMSDLAQDDHEAVRARTATLGETEATLTRGYYRKDGSPITVEFTSRAFVFAGRRSRITVVKDVTERYEAEKTRALLAAIVESSNDAIVSTRLDGTITSWNAAAEGLFGYSAEEVLGKSTTVVVPPDRFDEERLLLGRVAAGDRIDQYESVRRRKDGADVAVAISFAPVRDAAGVVVGASKTARDLTAQRKADEALRRSEEQLRQAQKMEAVGRLAGGIAHDFNNILSVILSYCGVLLEDTKPGDPIALDVEEIRKAAGRATELTQQLLVFSRQQVLMPTVLDLNDILADMDRMLKRVLGEDIDLVASTERHLGRIRADRGSVEQVIMNLVVNARDAMPTGGLLTIETANVELDQDYVRTHLGSKPGPHVMLAVTDTGTGMDRATQARIFEPFFTTKAAGKGTGLGLATVFGIAQQGGGSVWVYSEPGHGTTLKVYFPRLDSELDLPAPSLAPVTLRGSETILLVEDQEQVRTVAGNILKRSGYRVLVAQNAGEAILLSEKHPGTVHLLLTDVVMPQMSGPELAKRLAMTRPDLKVLCMSGYTDDSVVRHGVLDGGIAFLQKPFTPESLTRKVREVLNGSAAARRSPA